MRRGPLLFTLLAILCSASAGPAAADDESPAPEITNKTCPVMVGEAVDPSLSVVYRGKRVFFCCESCVHDFEDDPEAYLHRLPQFAGDRGAGPAAGAQPASRPADPREEHPLGGLHPLLVHFPVALTMVGAVAYLLSFLVAGTFLRNLSALLLVLSALFAVPAFLLGEEAEEALGRMTESRHEAVEAHETWGSASMYALVGVALLGLLARLFPRSVPLRVALLLALLAVAGVVGYTGYLGAEVARPGHLAHVF